MGTMIRHKYNAVRTELDGIKFSSVKESKYYSELKLRQASGEILFFLRQTPFHLSGGVKYIVDFTIFKYNGEVEFVDVKGFKTKEYLLKKKMVEDLYFPVKIIEV